MIPHAAPVTPHPVTPRTSRDRRYSYAPSSARSAHSKPLLDPCAAIIDLNTRSTQRTHARPTIFISAGEASGEALRRAADRGVEAAARRNRPGRLASSAWAASAWPPPASSASSALKTWRSWASPRSSATCPASTANSASSSRPSATRRPDVAVLIDFPDIHFRLAEEFHRLGVPVIYFVSPQLWAWKKHRIKLVQQYVDRMLVIFPFEEPFYRERGVDAEFVGHPLAELPLPDDHPRAVRPRKRPRPARNTWIGLLPGSRAKEIRRQPARDARSAGAGILTLRGCSRPPDLAQGIRIHRAACPHPERLAAQRSRRTALVRHHGAGLPVQLVDDARAALFHARASVVASGTATVEAALIGNPFVVVYRVSPLTYAIAKRVVKVPHVAMANLIAGKRVVPELIQNDFTAANIVRQIEPLLPDGPLAQSMMKELAADSRHCCSPARGSRGTRRTPSSGWQHYTGAARALPAQVSESVQS